MVEKQRYAYDETLFDGSSKYAIIGGIKIKKHQSIIETVITRYAEF